MSNTKKKINTLGLKIVSLCIAFILWVLVYNVSDNLINENKSIMIEIKNSETMNMLGLSYEFESDDYVKVRYKVRSNERSKVSEKDFRVYVDMTEYTLTGALPVHYEILNNAEDIISNISIEPSVVKIVTEEIQTKQFEVSAGVTDKPKENYEIGSIDLGINTVELTGPTSEIGRIGSVGVEIDVKGIDSEREGRTEIVFYDSNNNRINTSKKVTSNIYEIDYKINLDETIEVPIKFDILGEPIDNVYYASNIVIPDRVKIKGNTGIVNEVEFIDGGIIDVTGKTHNYTEVIDISSRIPVGVTLMSESSVKVTLNFLTIEPETKIEETNVTVATSSTAESIEATEDTTEESTEDAPEIGTE